MNNSDENLLENNQPRSIQYVCTRKWRFIILFLTLVVGFVLGYAVAFGIHKKSNEKDNSSNDKNFREMIVNGIDENKIDENLKAFSLEAHRAGGPRSKKYASQIADKWKSFGNIDVTIKEYSVMLSEPLRSGVIEIKDPKTKSTIFKSHLNESTLIPEEMIDHVVPYNAYSANADVQGSLTYVNYARLEDFAYLRSINVTLSGRILLCRYGKIFRANKVELAESHGAIGMIIYDDPHDYSRGSVKYPDSWWLPPDGVQRGTINRLDADPQTLGYPAIDGVYRLNANDTDTPKIPVHPISYTDALELFKNMDGLEVPKDWVGELNVTYRISSNNSKVFRLNVGVVNKPNSKIYNVIGKIKGHVEPDRLVILGNHHDAWVTGAIDPTSGTAVHTDIVRSFANALQQGWKPRRTILLCSWDAEEYGLIGSTEWIEENEAMLTNQAVAYLNVDGVAQGNFTLSVKASSQIASVLFQAANNIRDPDDKQSASVLETWRRKTPEKEDPHYPRISIPGSGSDFKTFFVRYGIPVTDLRYIYDWDVVGHIAGYPTYHSLHDSYYYVSKFVDPGMIYSATAGKVWANLAVMLADATILPFNFTDYARRLQVCHDSFLIKYRKSLSDPILKSFGYVTDAVQRFSSAATAFHKTVNTVAKDDILSVRRVNDVMMNVERSFIASHGLHGRPYIKHVLYGSSKFNLYIGDCFPSLVDNILETKYMNRTNEEQMLKDISQIYHHVLQGARTLAV